MIIRPDFFTHWKTKALVTRLDDPAAPIYVQKLWLHCELSKKWVFDNLPTWAVASICDFAGDAAVLDAALVEIGWITREGDQVIVEGWDEHNAQLVQRWEAGAKGGRPRKPERNRGGTGEEPRQNQGKKAPRKELDPAPEITEPQSAHSGSEENSKPANPRSTVPVDNSGSGAVDDGSSDSAGLAKITGQKPGNNRAETGAKPIDDIDDIDTNNPPNPPAGGKSERRPSSKKRFNPKTVELSEFIDRAVWIAWVEHRNAKRRPITEHGVRLLMRKLEPFREDANRLLNRSIERGWTGVVFEEDVPPAPLARSQLTEDEAIQTQLDAGYDSIPPELRIGGQK